MLLDKFPRLRNTDSDLPDGNSGAHASFLDRAAAFVSALLLIFVLLLTATQALCFWVPNWWRNEYAKYDTPANVRGEMSLDDAVHVTEDMLDYCIGRLDTLDETEATIDGVTSPFFTDREKTHLADCRALFMNALTARRISLLLLVGLLMYLYVHHGRKTTLRIFARGYLAALAAVLVFAVFVAIASIIDFTRVFTIFHKIFFNNDFWILYPDKDNLINIMQEDVFSDAAMWIAGMWIAALGVIATASVIILKNSPSKQQTADDAKVNS